MLLRALLAWEQYKSFQARRPRTPRLCVAAAVQTVIVISVL
jgi:hypothetical protein